MQLNRRRFIQRIASAGLAARRCVALCDALSRARLPHRPRTSRFELCMLSGSEEYKSNESLAAFQK